MTSKRHICSGCQRPEQVCLCDTLVHLPTPVRVTIWQDPVEAKHALSTAPLLQLCLDSCERVIGERLSYQDLFGDCDPQAVAVLYPMSHKPPLNQQQVCRIEHLLILDGTWRKVRKLLLTNPWLESLAHIALQPAGESRYAVRASPRSDGMSTLEAGVAALNWMTDSTQYNAILSVLERMVDIQKGFGHKQIKDNKKGA
ncbi:tRNA-uridine aminocarboxypropyltransferase [Thalassolituus sp. LLYu03]|uniref:tRNA-uridine aminocarboxypropyltransferase n=1 Tax=Thalassolituus sp. LLYu03 TaxID=3421656 RepID=UPI003D2B495C